MSRKKREAEEARLRAEAEARAAAAAKKPKVRTASWQKINKGPVPVARPADYIQLTPIVQPIPLVPYSRSFSRSRCTRTITTRKVTTNIKPCVRVPEGWLTSAFFG